MDNRRQSKRYDAEVAAEVDIDGEIYEGETHDISSGGVSAGFDAPISDGQVLALTLILTHDGIEDAHEEPFETHAMVMWSAPSDNGETMVGLRFTELEGPQQARLQRFLSALEG